ncbi:MAG TPA: prepilin-type N-terminal cleavage/methylation domain-containing protein [Bacillota bacterium]|nr:prepilin-type N-terminal cleavage/methylation domain-containing protein [Bacillota bacterium]
MKKRNSKGFTLAELLVVVAIIGVLVAISIPVFTAQLDKAKIATNQANARAAYAAAMAEFLGSAASADASYTYTVETATLATDATAVTTATIESAITAWADTPPTNVDKKVATVWQVVINEDGVLVGFNPTFP